jgi:hypothetical protein
MPKNVNEDTACNYASQKINRRRDRAGQIAGDEDLLLCRTASFRDGEGDLEAIAAIEHTKTTPVRAGWTRGV